MNVPIKPSPGEGKLVKVSSITLVERQDVYNMEVKHYHNFSIFGGLIVHNCMDSTRYLVMGMWKKLKPYLPVKEYEKDFKNPIDEEDEEDERI